MKTLSKSRFKAKALEFLREVERTGSELVITDHGRPVVKVVPYREDPGAALRSLRGSVRKYIDPLAPAVPAGDWDVHR
jgi:prevent-host-death family protein